MGQIRNWRKSEEYWGETMYKFTIRFLNTSTRQTERHQIETMTIGQALKSTMALTMGKDIKDLAIIQEEE
jgi:hypothetical protein